MTYNLTTPTTIDTNLTAERALHLAISAIIDDHDTAEVTDETGAVCDLEGDLDDNTVRLTRDGEILAIEDVGAEDLDAFVGA